MNLSTKLLCSAIFLVCLVFTSQAQEIKSQKFIVHEDMVHPSKIAEYEAISKTFAETMEQHNATGMSYLALSLDDYRYIYISAIDNLAALDNNPMKEVIETMGQDAFEDMMSGYDGTFETHKDYVINLNHDLSYKSSDIVMDGVDYRQMDYYYIEPGKWKEAKQIAKEWTELHTAKNAPHGYRIYTGGLGTEPMIMVVRWAKSAAELHANIAENQEVLGETSELGQRTLAVTRKRETFGASMRSDLSYLPKTAVAEN